MNNLSKSMPDQLPGLEINFGLKQCLGNTELYTALLHRFWKDYHGMDETLEKLNGLPAEQARLLHSFRGAAINLGMTKLGTLSYEIQQTLGKSEQLTDESLRHFRDELRKIGHSIEKLETFAES